MDFSIEACNLTKHFRVNPPVVACDNLSFKLEKGTLLSIVGPNGSGKTTLIRILAGVICPDQGTVRIGGYDIAKNEIEVKASLGVATPEHRNFYLRLTGRNNLQLFAYFYNLSFLQVKERIKELGAFFEIDGYMDKIFQEYSSGIKQRFLLARALLNNAPILLLDEPTKNLDPVMAGRFCRYLKDELVSKQKKTVLMTSHLLSEVVSVTDQIVILNEGKIKALGSLEELKKRAGGNSAAKLEDVYDFFIKSR